MWERLELPRRLQVAGENREMWTYWYLQEGEIGVDPSVFVTADGKLPPGSPRGQPRTAARRRRHAHHRRAVGRLLQAGQGQRPGRSEPAAEGPLLRGGPVPDRLRRGGLPRPLVRRALSHCMERFEGARPKYHDVRSGGVGAFTADNFPVFDYMRPNVFVIADSNHGYKMIAVGREVANVVLGEHSACSTRSATSASRPATSTRSRTAPIPGADPTFRARRSRAPRDRRPAGRRWSART